MAAVVAGGRGSCIAWFVKVAQLCLGAWHCRRQAWAAGGVGFGTKLSSSVGLLALLLADVAIEQTGWRFYHSAAHIQS